MLQHLKFKTTAENQSQIEGELLRVLKALQSKKPHGWTPGAISQTPEHSQ